MAPTAAARPLIQPFLDRRQGQHEQPGCQRQEDDDREDGEAG